jgi:hypothetical protein
MAKTKGGGASAKPKVKQLDSNKVSKLFSGVLITDLIKDDEGEGVTLIKPNKTLLGVVAEETAVKLGKTVSKPFGAPSMRYLLKTLGLCRVDIDLPSTDALLETYTEDVALRLATGSNTALWRIITGVRRRRTPMIWTGLHVILTPPLPITFFMYSVSLLCVRCFPKSFL